ncbi:MAG: hypothetical protein IJ862_06015 [Selenomonadaceae bacterium]|nr:hypothetical protein [Selenomonadaceae bacterium]
MFYVIATMLVILSIFFIYSAFSAFNELRKGIKKKVQAKPYMVWLFSTISLILLGLAYLSIVYQSTWDQNWNDYWSTARPILSTESKIKIYDIVNVLQPVTMYGAFGLAALFTLSLLTFRRLSAHLFVGSMALAVIAFICFIAIQYTEPNKTSKVNEQTIKMEQSVNQTDNLDKSEQSSDSLESTTEKDLFSNIDTMAVNQYFQNEDTDVLTLSRFVREHFRIPRDLSQANIDQLKQYNRGLTEIKQGLSRVNIPRGAEDVDNLTKEWLQQEIKIVNNSLAEKRETGIFGLMVKFNNAIADMIFDINKEHHNTTDKLRTLRAGFINVQNSEEESDLKEHFSFIK